MAGMNEAEPGDLVIRSPRIRELVGVTPAQFVEQIVPADEPVVLRGLVSDWPAVAAGRESSAAMAAYLRALDGGRPVDVMMGDPDIGGRFFYRDDLSGFNFHRAQVALPRLLDQLLHQADHPSAPALYAGAAPMAENYPGWLEANPLPLSLPGAIGRLWLGNSSRVSTHYDLSANIAAVVAGRRRFALFPPDQAINLYVGPLEVTIAGQPTSMVDLAAPDLDRYPRFAAALETMVVAELEPGDAIFIPPMWWHDVTASGPLNLLANYWWTTPGWVSPFPALVHAMLAVRDLPPRQRAALRSWFDLYVFDDAAAQATDHLPPHARGVLGSPSSDRTRMIRDYIAGAMANIAP